eukprot:TRINITY_DN1663_c0_g1_i1.p1 TRINITY_DN1663_c0_g1~~TRINITY_DN1663_c0_g1_i1.p1  ORF type:complete len:404 (+),score=113.38 TRINITY_DN1663_c0_g1_i1:81-1292(+)
MGDIAWTKGETALLIEIVNLCNDDWENASRRLGTGKTPQQCEAWYEFLELMSMHFHKSKKLNKGTRKRRKAAQIERIFNCREDVCNRSYGTEGALKKHIQLKHPHINYDEKYVSVSVGRKRSASSSDYDVDVDVDDEESGVSLPPKKQRKTSKRRESSSASLSKAETSPQSITNDGNSQKSEEESSEWNETSAVEPVMPLAHPQTIQPLPQQQNTTPVVTGKSPSDTSVERSDSPEILGCQSVGDSNMFLVRQNGKDEWSNLFQLAEQILSNERMQQQKPQQAQQVQPSPQKPQASQQQQQKQQQPPQAPSNNKGSFPGYFGAPNSFMPNMTYLNKYGPQKPESKKVQSPPQSFHNINNLLSTDESEAKFHSTNTSSFVPVKRSLPGGVVGLPSIPINSHGWK